MNGEMFNGAQIGNLYVLQRHLFLPPGTSINYSGMLTPKPHCPAPCRTVEDMPVLSAIGNAWDIATLASLTLRNLISAENLNDGAFYRIDGLKTLYVGSETRSHAPSIFCRQLAGALDCVHSPAFGLPLGTTDARNKTFEHVTTGISSQLALGAATLHRNRSQMARCAWTTLGLLVGCGARGSTAIAARHATAAS